MVKVFRPNQTSSKNYQQTQGKLNGAHGNRTMRENCKNVFISQGPSTAESKQFTQVKVLQRDSNQDSFRCERDIQGGGWGVGRAVTGTPSERAVWTKPLRESVTLAEGHTQPACREGLSRKNTLSPHCLCCQGSPVAEPNESLRVGGWLVSTQVRFPDSESWWTVNLEGKLGELSNRWSKS